MKTSRLLKNNLKLNDEKRKTSVKEKGITLVALVVTIIILLILAGVTLNGALSENGLFQRAKRATNEYKKAEEEETKAIEEIGDEIDRITFTYNDYVGCYVDGYKPKEGQTCKIDGTASGCNTITDTEKAKTTGADIGDNGDQEFTTEGDMGWRIWDYNKSTNTIRLISDKPTSKKLALYGANGYNNGVWAINKICETYGNTDIGATATSLKRTDIQKVSTYDYTQYKHGPEGHDEVTGEGTENTIQFGETKTYSQYYGCPTMWKEHDKNWTYKRNDDGTTTGKDDETIWEQEYNSQGNLSGTDNTEKTFKQSYYSHDYKEEGNEFIKNKYYDLLFKNGAGTEYLGVAYWLAGRCVLLLETRCDFDIQLVDAYNDHRRVIGINPYSSTGTEAAVTYSLRPIVSINLTDSKYELVKQDGDNEDIRFTLQPKTE